MSVRRVVTGADASGRHVIVADEAVEPLRAAALPGADMHYIWGTDRRVAVPSDGTEPEWTQHFPAPEGFRFIVFGLAPDTLAGLDRPPTEAELAEAEAVFPGLLTTFDDEDAGAHASATVDLAIVLSGRIVLEVDDGERRELGPGDVVVQNGTRHKWTNPGDTPAQIGFVLVGADHG